MRTILLNFMLKVGEGTAIPEESSNKLIAWADANKMKRALEIPASNSASVAVGAASKAVSPRTPSSALVPAAASSEL